MLAADFPRIWGWLDELRLDAALFSDPESICYLTNHANQSDTSFPFKGCPAVVLVINRQNPIVVLPGTEESEFRQSSWIADLFTYVNYDHERPLSITINARQKIADVMQQLEVTTGVLGYEALYLPASLREGLAGQFPDLYWRDITHRLSAVRAIKMADELAKIRQAAHLCDVGQARIRRLIAPGVTEIAIFADARAQMEQAAGQRIHVAGDLVTGGRSGRYGGGLPQADTLEDGHLVISDIVPRLNGWWGDSCATLAVGHPTQEQQKLYQIVKDAFQLGVEKARPGMKASELDSLVRGHVASYGYQYGHHTGHGVGVAQAEAPWIVPYNEEVLQEGMVITIEPGIYPGGTGGVRVEDLFLVTSDGLDPLTHHDKSL